MWCGLAGPRTNILNIMIEIGNYKVSSVYLTLVMILIFTNINIYYIISTYAVFITGKSFTHTHKLTLVKHLLSVIASFQNKTRFRIDNVKP